MALPPTSDAGDEKQQEAAERLGRTISASRSEIVRRWLERVQKSSAKTRGVELTLLRDGLPDYLAALGALLERSRSSGADERNLVARTDDGPGAAWVRVAREHGITRVGIGFDIEHLVYEFVVLRQVIEEVVDEAAACAGRCHVLLTDIIEAGITVAVQAYVDARDFELRRRQAEHVGFLTHELRNPLSTATLAASELRRHATPRQARILDALDRSHQKLNSLIDGVLLTERLESGKMRCRRSSVRLREVMDAALENARLAATAKGLEFRVTYDPELPIHVDPNLTRSAIQNLADNAVKYTDRGHVDVRVRQHGGELFIDFRDTCNGISSEELRTIFEPFERGTSRKPGTGLGLAIARRSVEVQGGVIGAESPGACGCHFWIHVPLRPASPIPRRTGRAQAPALRRRPHRAARERRYRDSPFRLR